MNKLPALRRFIARIGLAGTAVACCAPADRAPRALR